MAYKLICPGCDRYLSSIFRAYENGDPCPECGSPLGAAAEQYARQLPEKWRVTQTVSMDRGFKIREFGGSWAAYAPQGSGVGYYSTEERGWWYAQGSRANAESQVRCWIRAQDTDWSDPSWDE